MNSSPAPKRRPGGRMDPEADRLILEAAKRLLHEQGYDRLTMDAVASLAGVARTTIYRRYRDKAELVSAAIETLRSPSKSSDTGDARRDLIAQLENARRNFDMSLAGTLLMEEPYNPELLELFRKRMVLPRRDIVASVIEHGVERGQVRPGIDTGRVLDLLLGALFFAVLSEGRPGASWAGESGDALWPALAG